MKRLNIGSGCDIREGYINLDVTDRWGADVVFDLNKIYSGEKLPFNDNSFDEIIIFDVLEHLIEPLPILREIYRICKIGGTISIKVPNGSIVWDNLDHKRRFSKTSFMTDNFDSWYKESKAGKLEIIYIGLSVGESRNLLFKVARWIFNRTNINVKYRKIR